MLAGKVSSWIRLPAFPLICVEAAEALTGAANAAPSPTPPAAQYGDPVPVGRYVLAIETTAPATEGGCASRLFTGIRRRTLLVRPHLRTGASAAIRPAGIEREMEHAQRLALQRLVHVDQYIAADDQVELRVGGSRTKLCVANSNDWRISLRADHTVRRDGRVTIRDARNRADTWTVPESAGRPGDQPPAAGKWDLLRISGMPSAPCRLARPGHLLTCANKGPSSPRLRPGPRRRGAPGGVRECASGLGG